MTEKKTVAKKKAPNAFVKFFSNIGGAFTKMWRELKKVTWPTRKKLINYAVIVLLFMLFMTIVIGLLDMGATQLVNFIMNITSA